MAYVIMRLPKNLGFSYHFLGKKILSKTTFVSSTLRFTLKSQQARFTNRVGAFPASEQRYEVE